MCCYAKLLNRFRIEIRVRLLDTFSPGCARCGGQVDLPGAEPDRVAEQMKGVFDIAEEDLILVSAKTGLGVDKLLPAVIDRIPPPVGGQPGGTAHATAERMAPLKALLFDSWYDPYRGVINMIEVLAGTIQAGDKISFAASGLEYDVFEVGVLHPGQVRATKLSPGQVGYMISGMKRTSEARVGDTIYLKGAKVEPLPGFKPARCMVRMCNRIQPSPFLPCPPPPKRRVHRATARDTVAARRSVWVAPADLILLLLTPPRGAGVCWGVSS